MVKMDLGIYIKVKERRQGTKKIACMACELRVLMFGHTMNNLLGLLYAEKAVARSTGFYTQACFFCGETEPVLRRVGI